jgi:hypothetical protein
VCDIADHPRGYARISSLLAERASGPSSVAIASDCDQRTVPRLLTTAGWAIAFTEESTADEYAERFADGFTTTGSTPPGHRALGLARALHAGVLVATTMAPPSGLADLKPVLAADDALAAGRYGAAAALRDVLREIYPAALRAYPDPADPVALAVIDAIPEPGTLSSPRGRDSAATLDTVAAALAEDGVADRSAISEAITALRVAIAETPRRSGVHHDFAGAVAGAVRQAVAAVRACDAARNILVDSLAQWMAGRPAGAAAPAPAWTTTGAGGRETPAASTWEAPVRASGWETPAGQGNRDRLASAGSRTVPPDQGNGAVPAGAGARSSGIGTDSPPAAPGRPVSSPPPPPGITPISATRAAAPAPPLPARTPASQRDPLAAGSHSGGGHVRVPAPRPAPDGPPPGARDGWPTSPPPDDWAPAPVPAAPVPHPPESGPGGATPASRPTPATPVSAKPAPVTPPWLADDLRPPEPPPLRLVEPTLPEELREEFGGPASAAPPLRLVDPAGIPRSAPPVDASDDDGDLLIFAQARSAWFSGERQSMPWTSSMDDGWRAAEQAAHPMVDDITESGLPRRVPHANLVPGSPPHESERPLRVVRDPSSIAAHASGYFSGWRRGQEVGGYPLGNRVGQKAAGAWEFARDDRLSG